MDIKPAKQLAYKKIFEYIEKLKSNKVEIWRVYLYGSYANNTFNEDSDIDLAIFWDKDDLDGFEEDVRLMKLRRNIDLRIEPHSFAKSDFDKTNPFIKTIIENGDRII
ncbi:MAG: nucleotidyltransferase domain-containing protein [Pseudomonadota bacterium]|nr:nucleotidyltransferase domain-containing protein [Pseudomonadota bacterium]